MNTKSFRTKTEFIERNNGNIPNVWEIALDIGYSSVKLFSPNIVASFPSYARRINEDFEFAGTNPDNAILYKNLATNEMWLVGEVAQNTITTGDTSDSEASLYGRERYTNEMFKVISEVGLGVAMQSNAYGEPGNSKIVIQTGLPERYMNDEEDLIESLAVSHNFSLKIGNNDWIDYHFTVNSSDVYVISQPKGSLFSVCMKSDGTFHPDAGKYLKSSVLVFDPGFGTLDLFPIINGTVKSGETFSDLGMKRVLQETSKSIRSEYGVDIPVPSMQKYLETGLVKYMNKKTFESKEYAFSNLLEKANEKVCEEAINRMSSAMNLIDFDYMIITGGTGAAWLYKIQDKFKKFSTLTILNSNQNDNLPFIYSNVRGYYLYRYNKIGKELAERG